MCDNCICQPVCEIFRATGGVKKCKYHKEERRGLWIKINPRKDVEGWIEYDYQCSACKEVSWEEANYCPNCGADMRGAECE